MKTLTLSILFCFSALITNANIPPERIQTIQNSDDGKSAKTAYEVYNIEEEYKLLEHLK